MTTTGANGKRGEGQWALGYREPLNKNEEIKRADDGLNVRQRIIDIYSKYGFDSIDPADLRGRFRWYGLYTQRRPGIDGGRTAVLEPEELEDRYFMLRVRVDGGRLDHARLRTIAEVSRRYARGTADVTDRQWSPPTCSPADPSPTGSGPPRSPRARPRSAPPSAPRRK